MIQFCREGNPGNFHSKPIEVNTSREMGRGRTLQIKLSGKADLSYTSTLATSYLEYTLVIVDSFDLFHNIYGRVYTERERDGTIVRMLRLESRKLIEFSNRWQIKKNGKWLLNKGGDWCAGCNDYAGA